MIQSPGSKLTLSFLFIHDVRGYFTRDASPPASRRSLHFCIQRMFAFALEKASPEGGGGELSKGESV